MQMRQNTKKPAVARQHAADEQLHASLESIRKHAQNDSRECTGAHGPEAHPAGKLLVEAKWTDNDVQCR
jgi:hypothetical protein